MAEDGKKIEKLGCVVPYQVWEALRGHSAEVVVAVIDLLIKYDKLWVECQEKGIDILGKMTPTVAMAFSFAKPLIDGNNNKYYHRVKTNRQNAATGAAKRRKSSKTKKDDEKKEDDAPPPPKKNALKMRRMDGNTSFKTAFVPQPNLYEEDYDYIPEDEWTSDYEECVQDYPP